jgi:lipooligosaccharide transport system ATP-binding protein
VYGPAARLGEVEAEAALAGISSRRTGTSIALLNLDRANGHGLPEGERRPANLEDVFVLLTGQEIA